MVAASKVTDTSKGLLYVEARPFSARNLRKEGKEENKAQSKDSLETKASGGHLVSIPEAERIRLIKLVDWTSLVTHLLIQNDE